MSSHVVLPREGHVDKLFHLFSYLKHKHNATMVFDPTYPTIDYSVFKVHDWTKFYNNATEALPPDAPLPRGKGFVIVAYVDVDLAGNKLTRRSRTGFIVFLNQSPIYWFSKKKTALRAQPLEVNLLQ